MNNACLMKVRERQAGGQSVRQASVCARVSDRSTRFLWVPYEVWSMVALVLVFLFLLFELLFFSLHFAMILYVAIPVCTFLFEIHRCGVCTIPSGWHYQRVTKNNNTRLLLPPIPMLSLSTHISIVYMQNLLATLTTKKIPYLFYVWAHLTVCCCRMSCLWLYSMNANW